MTFWPVGMVGVIESVERHRMCLLHRQEGTHPIGLQQFHGYKMMQLGV